MSNVFRTVLSTSAESTFGVFVGETPAPRAAKQEKKSDVNTAVYGHIRAMRALGHTKVNTAQIARALALPVQDVDSAVKALKDKGVKVSAQ